MNNETAMIENDVCRLAANVARRLVGKFAVVEEPESWLVVVYDPVIFVYTSIAKLGGAPGAISGDAAYEIYAAITKFWKEQYESARSLNNYDM